MYQTSNQKQIKMKLELFSSPVFIGNIDLEQIKLAAPTQKAFLSQTPSSHEEDVDFPIDSANYLLSVIAELLKEKYEVFAVNLLAIWKNKYVDNDFQEPHVHTTSIFSFIIYEEVVDCHTIFFNPAKYLVPLTLNVQHQFIPQVRKGQIIVFPSYIEHMVNRNSDQVTISGNLDFSHTPATATAPEQKEHFVDYRRTPSLI